MSELPSELVGTQWDSPRGALIVGSGWWPLLVEAHQRLAAVDSEYRIDQVKEKFGRHAGLADPLYEQTQASVRLTLSAEPVDRELEARLPRDSRLIIAALRDAGELSTSEVAEAAGISRVTANRRLKKLQDAGLVEWTGKSPKDPRASWRLPPT